MLKLEFSFGEYVTHIMPIYKSLEECCKKNTFYYNLALKTLVRLGKFQNMEEIWDKYSDEEIKEIGKCLDKVIKSNRL